MSPQGPPRECILLNGEMSKWRKAGLYVVDKKMIAFNFELVWNYIIYA